MAMMVEMLAMLASVTPREGVQFPRNEAPGLRRGVIYGGRFGLVAMPP